MYRRLGKKRGQALLLGALWLAGLLGLPLGAGATGKIPLNPAVVGWPNAMASTGDSITRGYNTGTFPFTDAPGNSWSTGTSSTINTHYVRILAANPLISGRNY